MTLFSGTTCSKLFVLLLAFGSACAQDQNAQKNHNTNTESKAVMSTYGPALITRNIIQDKSGNIWIAAFDGIFKYDGISFTHITKEITSARFFSVLEDRNGNMWFGSIGSGAYRYDGKSFQHFSTSNGLLNNDVGCMFEDKKGNIWFGVFGGASRYDGKSFRNYIIHGDSMSEDRSGKTFSARPPHEVTSMIEDRTGRFWFATRGNTFVYDGKSFTVFKHDDIAFKNVRSLLEDKKGNIWLGGADGLWRYDGKAFTNFTQNFVGYIMEDKAGNIWTSSERDKSKIWSSLEKYEGQAWAVSRYDGKSLSGKTPMVTQIANKPMCFGILEAHDGSMWFGAVDGVYRYDGKTVTDFKSKEGEL